MKNKYFITIFLLIALTLTIGEVYFNNTTTNSNKGQFTEKIASTANRDKMPNATTGGVSLGLYNIDGNIESSFVFKSKKNESLRKFISVGNLISKKRMYRLLLLTDYKQSKFKVANKEVSYYNFEMNPYETKEIPVEIFDLNKGFHDILFVIVKYPDNKSLEDEFRKTTDMNHLLFMRFNVVVDDNKKPQYSFYNGQIDKGNKTLDGVFINKNKLVRWLKEEVDKSSVVNYLINIGNNSYPKRKYALIVLFDWKQTLINGKENVLFFELDKNSMVTISSKLNLPSNEGVYDLTPILIHNPYEETNLYNRYVETGVRVGIKVND